MTWAIHPVHHRGGSDSAAKELQPRMPNVERWPRPTRDRIVPPDPRPGFALLAGLGRARQLGLTQVTARSDSRLLIAHVNGEHQTRNGRLRALAAEITDQRMRIGTVVSE